MIRRWMVMVFCLAAALVLCGIPRQVMAEPSSKNEKTEKEKKKEKSDDKATSGKAADGVNKMFDGFKKNQGGVKKDAGKVKKSANDTYDKSK